jgi:hypothetical protein
MALLRPCVAACTYWRLSFFLPHDKEIGNGIYGTQTQAVYLKTKTCPIFIVAGFVYCLAVSFAALRSFKVIHIRVCPRNSF